MCSIFLAKARVNWNKFWGAQRIECYDQTKVPNSAIEAQCVEKEQAIKRKKEGRRVKEICFKHSSHLGIGCKCTFKMHRDLNSTHLSGVSTGWNIHQLCRKKVLSGKYVLIWGWWRSPHTFPWDDRHTNGTFEAMPSSDEMGVGRGAATGAVKELAFYMCKKDEWF